ncbi:MAG TPA: aldose 1-epimerase family protein [Caproiciproducens sp.]|nr:aldose 1-epimerase family protein [Caproiciproducens sp.]
MKYTLKNEDLTVQFNTFGGELTSIKDEKGTEYLWQGDKKYWGGQAPVLFPIVGSLRDKKATIGSDKTCFMERHGVARKMEFDMTEKTDDFITFTLCSDEETRRRYPYDFQLNIRYLLSGKNIINEYTVINKTDEAMPFQIGGHPGFNCPIGERETFQDYEVEFEQEETADCPALTSEGLVDVSKRTRILDGSKTLKMNHSLFKTDALIFEGLKSRSAKLFNPKTGYGIQVSFADFENLLLWSSANDGPFVALEPWNGLATCSDEGDVFEQKRGVRTLQSGESGTFSFTITVLN